MSAPTSYYGWHFLPEDGCLRRTEPATPVVAGGTYRVEGPLVVGSRGLFASAQALAAFPDVPGPIACRVLLRGEILPYDDGAIATERHVLAIADASRVLCEFALRCAEDVLPFTGSAHDRCKMAIDVSRWRLKGEVTQDAAKAVQVVALAAMTACEEDKNSREWYACRAAWRASQLQWSYAHDAASSAVHAAIEHTKCSVEAATDKYSAWLEEMLLSLVGLTPVATQQ